MVKHCETCRCDNRATCFGIRRKKILRVLVGLGALSFLVMTIIMMEYALQNKFNDWDSARFWIFVASLVLMILSFVASLFVLCIGILRRIVVPRFANRRLPVWARFPFALFHGMARASEQGLTSREEPSSEIPPPLPPKQQHMENQSLSFRRLTTDIEQGASFQATPSHSKETGIILQPLQSRVKSELPRSTPILDVVMPFEKERFEQFAGAKPIYERRQSKPDLQLDVTHVEIPLSLLLSKFKEPTETTQKSHFIPSPPTASVTTQKSDFVPSPPTASATTQKSDFVPSPPTASATTQKSHFVPSPPTASATTQKSEFVPSPPTASVTTQKSHFVPSPPTASATTQKSHFVPSPPTASATTQKSDLVPSPPTAAVTTQKSLFIPAPPKAAVPGQAGTSSKSVDQRRQESIEATSKNAYLPVSTLASFSRPRTEASTSGERNVARDKVDKKDPSRGRSVRKVGEEIKAEAILSRFDLSGSFTVVAPKSEQKGAAGTVFPVSSTPSTSFDYFYDQPTRVLDVSHIEVPLHSIEEKGEESKGNDADKGNGSKD